MIHGSVPAALFHAAQGPGSDGRYIMFRRDGSWQRQSQADSVRIARDISCALNDAGHVGGDTIGILSKARIEWNIADIGIMAAGMVTIGIYETSTPAQCAYILNHASVANCFVEDTEQAQKILSVTGNVPTLKHLVVFSNGLPPVPPDAIGHAGVRISGWDEFTARGERFNAANPGWAQGRLESITPDDTAIIVYTSGTTGEPKGVVLTHRQMLAVIEATGKALDVGPDDLGMVFLPLAHILQRTSNYFGRYHGVNAAYAVQMDKIVENMREVHPTTFTGVPRIFEKVHTRIMAEVARKNLRRKAIFNRAMAAGVAHARLKRNKKHIPLVLRLENALFDRLVYRHIRDVFGGRIRFMCSGGAPLSVELIEFFEAAGLIILEGYGLTETAAPCTVNRLDRRK
ncbi:MAG: AMP-binding protein, partial [Myxococcota bacterium]